MCGVSYPDMLPTPPPNAELGVPFCRACHHHRPVYMYCTGGIRCERASALLRRRLGVKEVYQLSGGIHRYIDKFGSGGLFKGKNFVFDRRLAIGSAQSSGGGSVQPIGQCVQCERPWDQYCKRWVCSTCNVMVLLCPQCASAQARHPPKRSRPATPTQAADAPAPAGGALSTHKQGRSTTSAQLTCGLCLRSRQPPH